MTMPAAYLEPEPPKLNWRPHAAMSAGGVAAWYRLYLGAYPTMIHALKTPGSWWVYDDGGYSATEDGEHHASLEQATTAGIEMWRRIQCRRIVSHLVYDGGDDGAPGA